MLIQKLFFLQSKIYQKKNILVVYTVHGVQFGLLIRTKLFTVDRSTGLIHQSKIEKEAADRTRVSFLSHIRN